jgi:antirestriction protein
MTIKQKFSSIDQSKLTADQKAFLTKIKDVTKNFTDTEMNKKVEAPLNGFIEKAKEKMPEAIKSAPVRRTAKATPSQTKKPKRTAMSLAKEIRKEGESWNDARARASKMMKEDSKDLSKTVETELDKLTKLVRGQKNKSKLTGISGTDIKRDASRKAKPRGSRTVTHSGETSNQYGTFNNKLGRKYTENRDRHSDRLAPNYPKNAPLLENGGFFSTGRPKSALMRDRKNVNHSEDYEVRYSKPRPSRTGYNGNRRFELGGTMVTDLAGNTGGGDAELNAGMPLDGFSNTSYTGLVAETGAMSSGEMFVNGGGLPTGSEQSYIITEALGNPAQHFNTGGSVTNERKHVNHNEDYEVRYAKPRPHRTGYEGKRSFNTGGAITNERKHVNHDEDYEVRYAKPRPSRKGYKGARKFMAGGSMETPRIYVADLEAYNNGRLEGEWLDLADYNDADELMDAIQDVLKKSGGEEYAIHDVEYIPSSMYSEYMGKRDFEELYEMMDLAKQNDLPLEVVQEIVSQFSESAVDDFYGKFDSAVDFAEQLVDEMGIESFNDFEYYLDISETDRRLLSQEMADSYVEDIRDEDGGNRLIEEAGLDLEEYEDASDESKEEMLDLASSMVSDEYYDTWYEGLSDPKGFLVDEQGMYSVEDFAKANFVRVDYDRLADALEQDYTFIEHDGDVYVFNIR